MKSNKYWDTIWSERDQEFLWSGTKIGFVAAVILTSSAWVLGVSMLQNIKDYKNSQRES